MNGSTQLPAFQISEYLETMNTILFLYLRCFYRICTEKDLLNAGIQTQIMLEFCTAKKSDWTSANMEVQQKVVTPVRGFFWWPTGYFVISMVVAYFAQGNTCTCMGQGFFLGVSTLHNCVLPQQISYLFAKDEWSSPERFSPGVCAVENEKQ